MNLSRRMIVSGAVAALGAGAISGEPVPGVKALVFDTFGTLVDWRGSIIAEGEVWERQGGSRSTGPVLLTGGAPGTRRR